eukprot:351982-Pyramimonas_sp.AAC.1
MVAFPREPQRLRARATTRPRATTSSAPPACTTMPVRTKRATCTSGTLWGPDGTKCQNIVGAAGIIKFNV